MYVPDLTTDQDLPGPGCLPEDPSNDPLTAWEISAADVVAGTPQSDLLCPLYDDDFWKLVVSGERQLVEVEANYNRTGNIQLAVDWIGPKSLCVPASPTACTSSGDCSGGGFCDVPRGGCRDANAPICFGPAHCTGGMTCARADLEALRGPILETPGSSSLHRVSTLFPAFIEGTYVLGIYDRASTVEDDRTSYSLVVRTRQDSDVNEPNDAPHLATPLTDNTPTSGTFSYSGDTDWFRITPGFTGTAVILVELFYPDGMPAVPGFRVLQDNQVFATTDPPRLPGAVVQNNVSGRLWTTARVLGSANPIDIEVINTTPTVLAPTHAYTLTVRVLQDTDEPTRDDRATTARAVNIGAPGSGTQTVTQRIIAENDYDWFSLSKTGADWSLLDLRLAANFAQPADAPILLQVQAYYPRSGSTCTLTSQCNDSLSSGRPEICLTDLGTCAVWFQRPAIELPDNTPTDCSSEFGGCPTERNNLRTQIPVPPQSQGSMLVQVKHIDGTPLAKIGYSTTVTYTLTLNHKVEPDSQDRTGPDNRFVPRPLVGEFGVGYNSFHIADRTMNNDTNTTPGARSGENFALLASSRALLLAAPPAGCLPLTIDMYDDLGATLGSGTVSITATNAQVFNDAACTSLANSFALPAATPFVLATAAGPGTIVTSMGTPLTFQTSAYTTTAPRQLAITGPNAGNLNAVVGPFTVTVPSAATANVVLNLAVASGTANFNCQEYGDPLACVATAGLTSACPAAGGLATSACQIQILSGQTSQSFYLVLTGGTPNLVVFTVTDAGGVYLPATWAVAPREPTLVTFTNASLSGSGYLSYVGDADFFTVNVPSMSGVGDGTMTATLNYAGNVDMRVGIVRQSSPNSWCSGSCGISITPGNCSGNPCFVDGGSSCFYVTSGGSYFNVWVNDDNHDDWDDTNRYSFSFTFEEGCASYCHPFACQ